MPASERAGGAPRVSIVVNNHDYAAYLGEAIDSALAQTYDRVEVVVVDDGSTDDSRRIIAGYGDRVKPVLKANGGQASALNAGFRASTGDLVLFLDADDALEPEAAAEVAGAWERGVAKIQFPLRVMDADGRTNGALWPADPLSSGDLRALVLERGRYGTPPTSGNAFPRDVLERLMPVPEREWRRFPDTYLILLAALLGEIRSIPRPLGRYRQHGANAWWFDTLSADRLRDHLEVDEKLGGVLRQWAESQGDELPGGWPFRIPNHLQSRLGSLRLDPTRHPYPADRRWRLAARGVGATLSYPEFTFRKRLALAAWFVLVGALPRRAAVPLIEMGFIRGARPAFLRRVGGAS